MTNAGQSRSVVLDSYLWNNGSS